MPTPFQTPDLQIPETSELALLLQRLPDIQPLRFEDGEFIIQQGEAIVDFFIVISGGYVVEQALPEPGRQPMRTLAVGMSNLSAPSFVGEMAYLGGGFRTASVRSSGATYTLKLQQAHMEVIIAEFPFFTRILCRQLTARLEEANRALQVLSMETDLLTVDEGTRIVEKGQPADTLYQLVDGGLVLDDGRKRTGDERIISPEQLPEGFIEPAAFLRDACHRHTLYAATPAALVAISKKSKEAVIRNFPGLILRLCHKSGSPGAD